MSEIITLENLLYEKTEKETDIESVESVQGNKSSEEKYKETLDKIIQIITQKHAANLAEGLYSKHTTQKVKDLIKKYIITEKMISENENLNELVERIYEDMAGIGFLKKYLENPDVEEIIFIPAEMRGAEAISAIEAARTGHTALTSIQASSAEKAYTRMLNLINR